MAVPTTVKNRRDEAAPAVVGVSVSVQEIHRESGVPTGMMRGTRNRHPGKIRPGLIPARSESFAAGPGAMTTRAFGSTVRYANLPINGNMKWGFPLCFSLQDFGKAIPFPALSLLIDVRGGEGNTATRPVRESARTSQRIRDARDRSSPKRSDHSIALPSSLRRGAGVRGLPLPHNSNEITAWPRDRPKT